MVFDAADSAPIPLSKRPCGIATFRVEGWIGSEAVQARWDGRWMIASKPLSERVALALAVDQVFVEAGMAAVLGDAQHNGPEELMLAVLTCCDAIDVAEYEFGGHRRVITSNG